MPYWWDGPIFRQNINLYLPKLTIDLADPYNSMLAIESCNHYRSSFSVSVAHIADPFQSSLILVKTVCMYAKLVISVSALKLLVT